MRSQHFADDTVIGSRLLLPKLWQRLSPILFKNRSRVGLAVLCLLGAKVALMYIPFLLKALVDGLETDPNQLAIQAILILVLRVWCRETYHHALWRDPRYLIWTGNRESDARN